MAVWRRKPKHRVMIPSDQGAQFTRREGQSFLRHHNLQASMSRRGNGPDSAVAESFSQLLKRCRIRRRTYPARWAARRDMFDCTKMCCNPTRKHTNNGLPPPVDVETSQQKPDKAGVWETRGASKLVFAGMPFRRHFLVAAAPPPR